MRLIRNKSVEACPWSKMLVGLVRDAIPSPLGGLDDTLEYEVCEEKVFCYVRLRDRRGVDDSWKGGR